jgi:hypothetical protein
MARLLLGQHPKPTQKGRAPDLFFAIVIKIEVAW